MNLLEDTETGKRMDFFLQISKPQDVPSRCVQLPDESDETYSRRRLDALGKFCFVAAILDTTDAQADGPMPGVKVAIESPWYDPNKPREKEEAIMRLLAAAYKIMASRIVSTHLGS
jgi:hypothetical protein